MPGKLVHYGTFDVANYGDLLFPLILERRLGDLGEIVHVSPIGGPPPIGGGVQSVAPAEAPTDLAGVVVGGGHLIHASPSSLPAYQTSPTLALTAYPALWLGAAERALAAGVPLVWNAPGVPGAFGPRAAPVVAWATRFADRIALRDARSRDLLLAAGCEAPLEVVPDTGFEVASLYSADVLDHAYHQAFRARGLERGRATLAFHANRRYLREEVPLVAARIERIAAAAGALPILLALGPCHGDDELARALGRAMRGEVLVVDRPQSLVELAACIARSQAYVGSSLHGFITACAFGVRAAIVAREPGDGGKFSGLLAPMNLSDWLWRDWETAEAGIPSLLGAGIGAWQAVARSVAPRLEAHWQRLRDALRSPPRAQNARREADAAREALLRAQLDDFGIHALLLPHQAELTLDQMTRLERERAQSAALKASYRSAASALRARIQQLESATPSDGGVG